MVHHLCPSDIALLWVAQVAYLVGRPSNAGCNQPYWCVYLATNGNHVGTKQLVPTTIPKGIIVVRQQLSTGHEWGYVHSMLRRGGHGLEKDLQFFVSHPIYFPKLPKLVSLIHVLEQPAHPEVVNQRPILGYVSSSPHGYCTLTRLTKLWPIMQSCATGPGGTVLVVAMVALVAEYHGERIMVLPTPCTQPVVQWQHGPSKQGSFTPAKGLLQTKGTTGDPVVYAHGLVCWTRQPFVHISNLPKSCHSFALSFLQT